MVFQRDRAEQWQTTRWTEETHGVERPAIDGHENLKTLGAGGGTIAWIGKDGLLKVGPQSAGADPGPAC